MSLSQSILSAIDAHPVLATNRTIPCAMSEFGCNGTLNEDRLVAILPDGTKVGTCADYVTHTNIVRAAGTGSQAQRVFSWIINVYKEQNPPLLNDDGTTVRLSALERPANKVLDLRPKRRSRAQATAGA